MSGSMNSPASEVSTTPSATIAVDIDEVLCPLIPHLVHFYNEIIVEENDDSQLHQNPVELHHFSTDKTFEQVWNCSYEESDRIVTEYLKSDYFHRLEPFEGAHEILQELAKSYQLVIVTSRHEHLRNDTKKFMDKYYPGIFMDILMGNHWASEGKKYTKFEMCQSVGASILIDDSPKHVFDVEKEGMAAILFGDYPWNAFHDQEDEEEREATPAEKDAVLKSKNIVRVASWKEVPQAIKHLLKQE